MNRVLTGKVVGTQSGTKFTDGVRRITIHIEEADQMFQEFRIADETLYLDQKVAVQITALED
jgi:hypothetical protein